MQHPIKTNYQTCNDAGKCTYDWDRNINRPGHDRDDGINRKGLLKSHDKHSQGQKGKSEDNEVINRMYKKEHLELKNEIPKVKKKIIRWA